MDGWTCAPQRRGWERMHWVTVTLTIHGIDLPDRPGEQSEQATTTNSKKEKKKVFMAGGESTTPSGLTVYGGAFSSRSPPSRGCGLARVAIVQSS